MDACRAGTVAVGLLMAFTIVTSLNSCSASGRTEVQVGDMKCIEPPPDVVTPEVNAKITAAMPKIEDILSAEVSVQKKYERIRDEVPNLGAVEVLEYRLCVACGNGLITKAQYNEYLQQILPKLLEQFEQRSSKDSTASE